MQRGHNLEVEAKSLSASRPASDTLPSRSASPDLTRNTSVTEAKDGPQDCHLEQDPFEQPTRSGDTTWHSVPGIDVRPPGSDISEDESAALVCPAFAGIQMAYLQAAIANVFMYASVINATSILNTTLNILDAAGTLPFHP